MYDATRPETVANLSKWFDAVRAHCGSDIPCLVVANKSDLVATCSQEDVKMCREKAHALAQREFIPLMETSAKTSEGVDSVFLTIAARYMSSKAGRMKGRGKSSGRGDGQIERRRLGLDPRTGRKKKNQCC